MKLGSVINETASTPTNKGMNTSPTRNEYFDLDQQRLGEWLGWVLMLVNNLVVQRGKLQLSKAPNECIGNKL